MQVLYFAWLKQQLGTGAETVAPPAEVGDVDALMAWLAGRGEPYASALAQRASLRAAVNREFASGDTPVRSGDEVALFPPVTGG